MRLHDARMQQILPVPINVIEYVKSNYQDQIASPSRCSNCNDTQGLCRHGTYGRWISWCLETVRILVARFLCRKCGRTVSCLPDWALSYRRVNVHTTQRYLDGERGEREIFQWESLLRSYSEADRFLCANADPLSKYRLGCTPLNARSAALAVDQKGVRHSAKRRTPTDLYFSDHALRALPMPSALRI